MSFKVLVDDGSGDIKVVHEVKDQRVTRVGLLSNEGETGAFNVSPNQTEVLLRLDYAVNDGRPTLVDVESTVHPLRTGEEAQAAIDKLKELPSSTNFGISSILSSKSEEEEKEEDSKESKSSSTAKKAS